MDEVSPGLFVGTVADAEDGPRLRENGVDRVVSLTHSDPQTETPVTVSNCAMMDGPRNERETFREAVEHVLAALEGGETVLVHCNRGASRSPSVAAAATALHGEIGIEDAFELVGERRAAVDPHPALVEQAVELFRERSN